MFAITKNEYFAVSTANKSQELVIISKRDCTVWNKILALLGFGPLKNRDFRPTSVAAYLGSHFLEELKNKYILYWKALGSKIVKHHYIHWRFCWL